MDPAVKASLQQLKWLEDDDNLSKWESGALTASDRRVLLTFWSGEAYEKLWKKHISGKSFDGTGCNLTIDLSELEKVQPQNMHQYSRELKKRLELALQNEQVVSADEIEANAMQVESAPAASGELKADSSEEECADDAYDSDNGEASDDETIEAAPFWVPEGMQSMPEMPELTKRLVGTYILFKWEVYGWQYGRVKKILARNNSGYNFKVYYRTEDLLRPVRPQQVVGCGAPPFGLRPHFMMLACFLGLLAFGIAGVTAGFGDIGINNIDNNPVTEDPVLCIGAACIYLHRRGWTNCPPRYDGLCCSCLLKQVVVRKQQLLVVSG
ncbi:hypothetical protein CYMTET_23372 [Cymbomonas tetramitiformis]|uniref:Uncharacterized protein n=1 Tax=Cymbomonas tetramitiformis TaxID=36881 RepID=A0AAE0FZH2_9CHLO|nr:hypothetical protein CYMTET_23372 [Cymbomonas tetramitiformis]